MSAASATPPAEHCDVAVIGAGPAGAMAAFAAARAGRSVVLIDKAAFPRPKVCGCCLSGAATAALRTVGLEDVLREAVPLRTLTLAAGGRVATLPLHDSAALSRAALDAALVERARHAGAHFRDATTARLGDLAPDGRRLTLKFQKAAGDGASETSLCARGVIVADGLGGRLLDGEPGFAPLIARRGRIGLAATLDAAAPCPPGEVRMAVGRGGYVGLVALEDGRAHLAAALEPAALRNATNPAAIVSRIVEYAGFAIDRSALAAARWHGTPPLTRRRPRLTGRRLLVVGDAAGYVEPFTGEGIGWALATGETAGRFAAELTAHPAAWPARAADGWQKQWRRTVGGPQWRCRVVAAMLRYPAAVAVGVGLLRRMPGLGQKLTRPVASPLKGASA